MSLMDDAIRHFAKKVASVVRENGPKSLGSAMAFQEWCEFIRNPGNWCDALSTLRAEGLTDSQISYIRDFAVNFRAVTP